MLTSCKALHMRLVKIVGLLCLSSVTLIACAGSPAHRHGPTTTAAKPATASTQTPRSTNTTTPSTTTTTTTLVIPTTTTVVPSVATQPVPEGSVQIDNAQPQTFSLNNGCNDVSFGIDNESNTPVDSATVMFTMNTYSADGSYNGPGPTQGPYGVTVYVFPYSQKQVSVQVCPNVGMALGSGQYLQVTGVSGTYTWAA